MSVQPLEAWPSLARETGPLDQPKTVKARSRGAKEVEIRALVETWGRARWPDARVCHELVMDRGNVRLDVAFVRPNRLVVVELKSAYDTMERVIHQVAMARLSANEAWLVTDPAHVRDLSLIRYLLPTVGLAEAVGFGENRDIKILAEPDLNAQPHPQAMASVLWVAELAAALGIVGARPGSHASLARCLAALEPKDLTALACRELRARDALWRADPPIRDLG